MSSGGNVKPMAVISLTLVLFLSAMGSLFFWVPQVEEMRAGTLFGAGFGYGIALLGYRWKLHSFKGKGTAFLGAMAGGFILNLIFLAGGTIVTHYSGLLGNHQGYAFGYLGAALFFGGIYTWFLRHGGRQVQS